MQLSLSVVTGLLIVARAVHIGSCMMLVALFAIPLIVIKPAFVANSTDESPQFNRAIRRALTWSFLASLVSGMGWFWLTLAQMSGVSLWEWPDMENVKMMITETQFGHVCSVRLGILLLLGISRVVPEARRSIVRWGGFTLTIALLTSLAGVGHAGASVGNAHVFQLIADGVHLLAAGFWPAGLFPLTALLVEVRSSSNARLIQMTGIAVRRFSAFSLLVVAVLVSTGLVNSFFLVGNVSTLVGTLYGRILIAKLLLFFAMIVIGAWNLFSLRKTSFPPDELAIASLQRRVVAELWLGVVIVIIVGWLGITPLPPVS